MNKVIRIQRSLSDGAAVWEAFIENANNSTIYHSLNFLAYHGNKFSDNQHHLLFMKGEKLYAIMPMGVFEGNGEKVARSPFGASIGGLVHMADLQLKYALEIVDELLLYGKEQQWNRIVITMPAFIYNRMPHTVIEFALISRGFTLANREVMHYIPLPSVSSDLNYFFDSKCRNQIRKGFEKYELHLDTKPEIFYPILVEDKKRHSATATHTLENLVFLKKKFSF